MQATKTHDYQLGVTESCGNGSSRAKILAQGSLQRKRSGAAN